MRNSALITISAIVLSFAQSSAQAQDCDLCVDGLKLGLKSVYSYEATSWDQHEATRFFCSDEFEQALDKQSDGVSLGVPIEGTPFQFDSTAERERFRESRKSACETNTDFISTSDMEKILIEDSNAALDAYKYCLSDCYASRKAVSGKFLSVNEQYANVRLSYLPNVPNAPVDAKVVTLHTPGLACNDLQAIPLAGAVLNCTWNADAKDCGQVTVTTTQGYWFGNVARPTPPLTATATIKENVEARLQKVEGHAAVTRTYTTSQCVDCRRVKDSIRKEINFEAEPGYVLDPVSSDNLTKVSCTGGTLRCSSEFLTVKSENAKLAAGGRSGVWTIYSRSEPATLTLQWRQSKPVNASTRTGMQVKIGQAATQIALPLNAGAASGSASIQWSDGQESTFNLGGIDPLGRLTYKTKAQNGGTTEFVYDVVRTTPQCE